MDTSVDKIVFLGDYFDSDHFSSEEQIHNLQEILKFKESLGNKVVLLLGNHDDMYITRNTMFSSYQEDAADEIRDLFLQNIRNFQVAYQVGKHLFTHAGITKKWIEELKFEDSTFSHCAIDRSINYAYFHRWEGFWSKSERFYSSKKRESFYSPLYCFDDVLLTDPLSGYTQYIGHTHVPEVICRVPRGGEDSWTDIYFLDCPWSYYQKNGGFKIFEIFS